MVDSVVQQWMARLQACGHDVCLMLDSQNEQSMRQSLLASGPFDLFASVYRGTQLAELADSGPFIIIVDPAQYRRLEPLLSRPQENWGWLASIAPGELQTWVKHWRARMIIGQRPHQALYRFHDNRVLTKALQQLPEHALPAYLGQATSVCYWNDSHWQVIDNPAPGSYPVPDQPMWLNIPPEAEQAITARLANTHRYLLAEHEEAYLRLAEQDSQHIWLRQLLEQAENWAWQTPEQLLFLLTQRLQAPDHPQPSYWRPEPGETPTEHFERVVQTRKFWQMETPL